MAYGLIHYNQPDLDGLEAFFGFAAEAGFDAVELMPNDVWPEGEANPEARAEKVRKQAEAAGISICALGAGNDFVLLDNAEIQKEVRRMERFSGLAKILGAPVIRTEGGRAKDSVPEERHVEAMADCLKRCRDFTERDKVILAVDNHGMVTNDADLQLRLYKEVDSPYVAATMDTMNYRWAGHDLETVSRFYKTVAPWVRHAHIKDGTGSRGEYKGMVLGEGEIDITGAIATLKGAGYSGVWCIEYEGKEGSVGYAKCLEKLKTLV